MKYNLGKIEDELFRLDFKHLFTRQNVYFCSVGQRLKKWVNRLKFWSRCFGLA